MEPYRNCTIHAIMQWQQAFCLTAQFWMKVDDDVVVHLPRLLHWINEDFRSNLAANPKAIFGSFVSGRVRRDKNDKWSIPYELYRDDYYPKYTSGMCYVMTSESVRSILNGTSSTNGFHVEDALYTGVIASNVGVQKFSRRKLFHTEEKLSDVTSCDSNNVPYSTAVFMGGADKTKRMGILWNRLKSLRCYSLLWRLLLFWK
ncbi:Beta-1,3-galactosyltransferase 2 [Aphelenchoides avenae]|nr:Beta-1,3-galactosyltransferase 2 [Aphelenchus avenae]